MFLAKKNTIKIATNKRLFYQTAVLKTGLIMRRTLLLIIHGVLCASVMPSILHRGQL